jgi:transposase-like protein
MNPSESGKSSGKRYSDAFKQEALALLQAGRSKEQVSRELGVSTWTLLEWQKRAAARCAPADACQSKADPTTAALAAEVALLRKQLAKSEQRADILKKALAILGQDPTDASK